MKRSALDEIDIQILNILLKNARTNIKDIAEEVSLSSPAVSKRIEKMEQGGYITGYQAQINPVALGLHIKAFIRLEVSPDQKKEFYSVISKCTRVVSCNCITGDYSMLIEVLFPSTMELDQFIGELQCFGRTQTSIVFSTAVEHRGVAIEYKGKK